MSDRRQQPPKTARGNILAFGLTSLFNDISSEMAYWILPAFLASLGAGPFRLGIIEGIAESVAASGKLLSGWLADHMERRKPLVAGGYVVANIAKPLLAVASAWWQVLFVRFADRTSKGIRGSARDVMLAESARAGGMGAAFGLVQAMDSAGAVLGPLLALLILMHGSYRAVFWWSAVPGILCVMVVLGMVRETPRGSAKPAKIEQGRDARSSPLPAAFWSMLAIVTLFSLANSSDMFLVLRAHDAGIPTTRAPLLGLVFNVIYTAASWPAGKISDRISKHVVAAAGYVVFAITYFIFAKAPSATAIWITMGGYGLYYALTAPVLSALVVEIAPAEARGRAIGIFYFVSSIAILLASLITGWLWKTYGAPMPFFVSSAVALFCALMLLVAGAMSHRHLRARPAPVADGHSSR